LQQQQLEIQAELIKDWQTGTSFSVLKSVYLELANTFLQKGISPKTFFSCFS
jgi:hypothetical protein